MRRNVQSEDERIPDGPGAWLATSGTAGPVMEIETDVGENFIHNLDSFRKRIALPSPCLNSTWATKQSRNRHNPKKEKINEKIMVRKVRPARV